MKQVKNIIIFSFVALLSSCITKFIPETTENQEVIVVEGLVTDQPEANIIKISKTLPLGSKNNTNPLTGCSVFLNDDLGTIVKLSETDRGTYQTDPASFIGIVGRKYTLKIYTNSSTPESYSYESIPMEMMPVPPIDSVYYEKKLIKAGTEGLPDLEGSQVYLNTHDPSNNCRFYRWDFQETWEIHIPYSIPVNKICWVSSNSTVINIKNTTILTENLINHYPLIFISNESDRLKHRYSILVNQYSIGEEEFVYWEKLQNFTEEVGSLYDITPSSIPSNIYCIEKPSEKALGYFSVSARSSKRIMIDEYFSGVVNFYSNCIADTIFNNAFIPNLGTYVWVLEEAKRPFVPVPYKVITYTKGCADCTVRGSLTEPSYWRNNK